MITLRGPLMVSRKLAIRDEPNIWLRCSRNVKIPLVLLTTIPIPPPSPLLSPCVRQKRHRVTVTVVHFGARSRVVMLAKLRVGGCSSSFVFFGSGAINIFQVCTDAFVRVQVFEMLITCFCAILFGWSESLWCCVRWFRCSGVVVLGVCLEVESQ